MPVDSNNPISRPLRVCYFGTYRAEYSRNRIMIEGLRSVGVEVVECHERLWHGIEDRVNAASGAWLSLSLWLRIIRAYIYLLIKYTKIVDHDLIIVGYPGQFDVYFAKILSRFRGKPLIWDVFMSIYLIALERGLDRQSPFTINIIKKLERSALGLPNVLVLDTSEYVDWFKNTHAIDTDRFRLVPTGADDRIFTPAPVEEINDGFFRVIYYGTFIPNHGVLTIVRAASLLKDNPTIQFELIGDGPEKKEATVLIDSLGLSNVTLTNWLDQKTLVKHIARADVCLGAFGSTPQSLMTVQNKIFEGLAMAKPVLTGDSPAVRSILTHGENIYLCKRGDPKALADAILSLHKDPNLRKTLSKTAYETYKKRFNIEAIGQCFFTHIYSLLLS